MLQADTPRPLPPLALARLAQVCDAVGDFVEYWGFKAIHGRVWAYLAVRAEPITQTEVARALGVSRALVSSTMAELAHYQLVRSVSARGRARYEAVMDVWPIIANVLRGREWMLLESARQALEAALEEAVPGGLSAERLRFLLTMTELAQSGLKMLIGLRTPRSARGLRGWLGRMASFVRSGG